MTYTDPGPFISFGELKGARENSYLLFQVQRLQRLPRGCQKRKPPTSPQVRGLDGAVSRYSHSIVAGGLDVMS